MSLKLNRYVVILFKRDQFLTRINEYVSDISHLHHPLFCHLYRILTTCGYTTDFCICYVLYDIILFS